MRAELVMLALLLVVAGCAKTSAPAASETGCANVTAVDIAVQGSAYRISATVSSTETGWDKYADAWEVRTLDGSVLGTRVLVHPHVDEQPFTRSLDGVQIPEGVGSVEVAARDSVKGFCGETVVVEVPTG